jgi:hypothetical protein
MKDIIVVYDDSRKPSQEIRSITGGKTFGETIFKRVPLRERIQYDLLCLSHVREVISVKETHAINKKMISIQSIGNQCAIVHYFSNFGLRDMEEVKILFEKVCYVNENYVVECDGKIALAIFKNLVSYMDFIDQKVLSESDASIETALLQEGFEKIHTQAFVDLSVGIHFRQFITSGFEARFFNVLEGDEYTVTKRSANKDKIRCEYQYYELLPEEMKMWYVTPFGYREDEKGASYKMERYHMTDIAIRYVHGAITVMEFVNILDKLFYYLKSRKEKEVTSEVYQECARNLYLSKIDLRMEQLKQSPGYQRFNEMIRIGTEYNDIDEIVSQYKDLYEKISAAKSFRNVLVVGHGDLCFSNILYNDETFSLKLIDPRGATTEEELYMNPYYDMAKLSHSICGGYDFFNSDLFELSLAEDMQFKLTVMAEAENIKYREIFREYLEKNGADYKLIRLYEASLFLSMLPLHMDREKKVFAFLLNAIQILKEIEQL